MTSKGVKLCSRQTLRTLPKRTRSVVLLAGVLGLARTGLIFSGLQEGAQLGGGGWPHLAKQSPVFHTMCPHAGFRWAGGRGGNSLAAWGDAAPVLFGRAAVWVVRFVVVFSPYLYRCCSCFPSVCCSVKLPLSRPTSFCLFLSILLRTPAGGGAAAWRFCCRRQPKPKHKVVQMISETAISHGLECIYVKM